MSARPGPVPAPIGSIGVPFYRFEISRRNRAYDRGRGVSTIDRPVISVGNLSVGGTGKTPTVRALLDMLLDAGHCPCVAMRGYKSTPRRESDEAAAHRRAFPTVPIVAQPDRIAGLRALFETEIGRAVDCVVLDDGFQHRRLARDLDVVLIDATRSPFADKLLPAGWLREPTASLSRAHAVIVTHADRVRRDALEALLERVGAAAPGALVATSRHSWTGLRVVEEGVEHAEPGSWLAGRRVVGVCAIGNPGPFFQSVELACSPPVDGAPRGAVLARVALRDHDPFDAPAVERIAGEARVHAADAIVVTEKDWSKLASVPESTWPCPIVRPRLRIEFLQSGDELRKLVLDAVRRD
ncbi:MAG: tetraacyldisaccharide 4'-kinase [Phycisphaerales bacterium]